MSVFVHTVCYVGVSDVCGKNHTNRLYMYVCVCARVAYVRFNHFCTSRHVQILKLCVHT